MIVDAGHRDDVVAISALTGEGVDTLLQAISARLTQDHRLYSVELDASDGAGAAWLHAHGEVLGHSDGDDRVAYQVRLAPRDYDRFVTREVGSA